MYNMGQVVVSFQICNAKGIEKENVVTTESGDSAIGLRPDEFQDQ
jgi:hypothetical protein